jgi:putative NADH-flavin reductase
MKLALFGATGRTGKEVLLQSLVKGYEVKVLARNKGALDLKDAKLQVIEGDALDAAAVNTVVEGSDVVMVALGARTKAEAQVHSIATQHIVNAMKQYGVKRVIVVSSAGIFGAKDGGFFFGSIIRPLFLKKIFDDKLKQLQVLEKSDLDWILVRPSQLIDGQKTGKYHITEDKPAGKRIARADVADFMLGQLNGSKYLGKMPILSY